MKRLLFIASCLCASISVHAAYPKREITLIEPPTGCTAILVDNKASLEGSMTTHTNDCNDCDFRLSHVPARDWPENSMRPVAGARFAYPRYVGDLRGETFKRSNVDRSIFDWPDTKPIGYIPQVAHTYAYIDGAYGLYNEHQLAMGESTCAARLVAAPLFAGGKALFDISELGRIALERCKTARCAIQTMGDLATEYGYYGSEWTGEYALGEAGEALTVTDPNESWVFHILPDSTGQSAIWAAKRVPSGHITVIANAFTIGDMDLSDHENFLYSSNLVSQAKENKFWDESWGPFNFAAIYGETVFFEIYCSRRMWRIFSLVSPSLSLNSNATVAELPFSVKPEKLLSKYDIMTIQRDHYEGTEYDLTKGLAAGPYGNPNRFDRSSRSGVPDALLYQGTFERAISLFRTAYSFVTLSRSWVPDELAVIWFSPSVPHSSFYAPLYVSSGNVPKPLASGNLYALSRDSTWWASQAINNYMGTMYMYMLPDVQSAQQEVEFHAFNESVTVESKALDYLKANDASSAHRILKEFQNSNSEMAGSYWWGLFDHLLGKFHDGQRVDDVHSETFSPTSLFYPGPWLEAVGFWQSTPDLNRSSWSYTRPPRNRPHPPRSTLIDQTQPVNGLTFKSSKPQSLAENTCNNNDKWTVSMSLIGWIASFFIFSAIFIAVGMWLQRLSFKRQINGAYQQINQIDDH